MHHPVDPAAYYDEQKPEASRRAKSFRAARLPKFLRHFQAVLESNSNNEGENASRSKTDCIPMDKAGKSGPYLLFNVTTMADLALFHMISGLHFAFPRRLKTMQESGSYSFVRAI